MAWSWELYAEVTNHADGQKLKFWRMVDSDQQHANEPAWAFEGDEWVPLVEDTALSQITPRK